MFYLLLCIIFLGAAFLFTQLKMQNFFTRLAKYSLFSMALLSLLVFSYNAWLLPDTISRFYNGGDGIAYTNAEGVSTVFYNESSDEVAYYFMTESLQIYTMDFIKTYLIGLIGIMALVGSVVYYALFHNIFGDQMPNSIEDTYKYVRTRLFGGSH